MKDCDNCICCTATGICTENVHDVIINRERVIVGKKRCPVFDGEAKVCPQYWRYDYYHRDVMESESE